MIKAIHGDVYYSEYVVRQLMEEILHQLIGSLSHYLQGMLHPRWCISCVYILVHRVMYVYTIGDVGHYVSPIGSTLPG